MWRQYSCAGEKRSRLSVWILSSCRRKFSFAFRLLCETLSNQTHVCLLYCETSGVFFTVFVCLMLILKRKKWRFDRISCFLSGNQREISFALNRSHVESSSITVFVQWLSIQFFLVKPNQSGNQKRLVKKTKKIIRKARKKSKCLFDRERVRSNNRLSDVDHFPAPEFRAP